MQELFRRVTGQINQLWERTEKRDRIRFFVIAGIAIAAIVVSILLLTRTEYAVLYHDMEPADAGQTLNVLKEMGIDAKAEGTGTILVPANQLSDISMQLATQKIPNSGFTYDTFKQAAGYGTTDYEKKKYDLFQMQDRLQQTIQVNKDIRQAVVTLSVPDTTKTIFQSEVIAPSASIMLVMQQGAVVEPESVTAIENLVVSAVPGLERKNVSITDNSFNVLNGRDDTDFSGMKDNLEFERAVEENLQRKIHNLLMQVFGLEHVQVGVDVELDFDDRSAEKITFSPVNEEEMTGIDISFEKITEKAQGIEVTEGEPGIDENGGAAVYPEVNATTNANYSKVTEQVNREVNELQEKILYQKGKLMSLTVSVLADSNVLDNTNPANPDPRSDPGVIRQVVGGTVGLKAADWNDLINISYLPFTGLEGDKKIYQDYIDEQNRIMLYDLIRAIALYAIIAACVIVIFLTLSRMFRKKPSEEELEAMRRLDEMGLEGLTEEELEMRGLLNLATEGEDEDLQIEEKKSLIRGKIEDFIDRNPESVANLLRNWLTEDDGGKW